MRFMAGGQDRVLRERGGGRVSREFLGLESGAFLFLFLFSFFLVAAPLAVRKGGARRGRCTGKKQYSLMLE
jgi:hypothetical protein